MGTFIVTLTKELLMLLESDIKKLMLFVICESLLTDSNSILKNAYHKGMVECSVSGSSSQYINGTIQKTKPEYAFNQMEKKYDWCSECGRKSTDHTWITLSIKNSNMRLNGYYIKAGCCGESGSDGCCCYDIEYCCRCCLYSWSFQISNDNVTWKTVHSVEKDMEMVYCKDKTYKFSESYNTRYIRLIQDEACPGDPPCIAINKIELIGTIDGEVSYEAHNFESEDDDVSIIGHISKNRM